MTRYKTETCIPLLVSRLLESCGDGVELLADGCELGVQGISGRLEVLSQQRHAHGQGAHPHDGDFICTREPEPLSSESRVEMTNWLMLGRAGAGVKCQHDGSSAIPSKLINSSTPGNSCNSTRGFLKFDSARPSDFPIGRTICILLTLEVQHYCRCIEKRTVQCRGRFHPQGRQAVEARSL